MLKRLLSFVRKLLCRRRRPSFTILFTTDQPPGSDVVLQCIVTALSDMSYILSDDMDINNVEFIVSYAGSIRTEAFRVGEVMAKLSRTELFRLLVSKSHLVRVAARKLI